MGEVRFEPHELGNPDYGCELGHIDFAAYARSVGATGIGVTAPGRLREAIRHGLAQTGPVVIDVQVDPNEPTLKPEKIAV